MPLGFERLNERTQRPNKNVNFIKPLDGPDNDVALDFLSRIAAISAPVMRENHLYVMSLEEFPPNREFWGRNFNNGESIQLVLKSPSNGRWLPFKFVQMVFMHELAHCKQMNHGREFWKLRNAYSGELRELWRKSYTGDGLWGRGQSLYNGQYAQDSLSAQDVEDVKNLCGGTFRGVRSKRKRKPQLSYAERKQRRIEKKFGKNGMSLGDDEIQRTRLEQGKTTKGKPRVAGSNRGRDLRAAALLDRLEKDRRESSKSVDEDTDTDETLDYDYDYDEFGEEALDGQGNQILDAEGHRLVKVCEDEDPTSDPDAANEMEELVHFSQSDTSKDSQNQQSSSKETFSSDSVPESSPQDVPSKPVKINIKKIPAPAIDAVDTIGEEEPSHQTRRFHPNSPPESGPLQHGLNTSDFSTDALCKDCPVCSLTNDPVALTCTACGHVLDVKNFPDYWRCSSEACQETIYLNPGDNGVCGICGSPKSLSQSIT